LKFTIQLLLIVSEQKKTYDVKNLIELEQK